MVTLIAGIQPHTRAIAEQQIWGWAAVRRADLSGAVLARTVALNLFMGFVIVALKLALPGH